MAFRQVVRAFSSTVRRNGSLRDPIDATGGRGVVPDTPSYRRLMKLQEEWGKDSERLVWQKKPIDGFLFYTTLALVAVGFVLVDYELYTKMLYPAKKN